MDILSELTKQPNTLLIIAAAAIGILLLRYARHIIRVLMVLGGILFLILFALAVMWALGLWQGDAWTLFGLLEVLR